MLKSESIKLKLVVKKIVVLFFISLCVQLLFSTEAYSFPQFMEIYNNDKFAKKEKKNNCGVCHVNSGGSGPLNGFGQAFEDSGRKITNDLRQQFPDLFDLFKATKPRIKRIKPRVFIVGIETQAVIKGMNFTEDSIIEIDGENVDNLQDVNVNFISMKKIMLTITFEESGRHKLRVISPIGQKSKVFKVVVKVER